MNKFRLLNLLMLILICSCETQNDIEEKRLKNQITEIKNDSQELLMDTEFEKEEEIDSKIKILKKGLLRGKFFDVVSGDYQHFIVIDSINKYHDFFISNTLDQSIIDDIQTKSKEDTVELILKWRTLQMFIPEENKMDTIEQVYKIKIEEN